MEEWINNILTSDQTGFVVLIAVFLLGLISLFTCGCNFSIIGLIAGYSGATGTVSKPKTVIRDGLFFLTGIVVSMSVIGGIIGYAGGLVIASLGNYWRIAAGLISIFFGLFSMGLLPFKIPSVSIKPVVERSGLLASVIFGLTVGGLVLACSACCNPVFPIVFAVSFLKGSFIWGISMLFSYALGYGLTFAAILIGIGIGTGKVSKTFSRFGKILKYGGGIVMIVIGFYLLLTL